MPASNFACRKLIESRSTLRATVPASSRLVVIGGGLQKLSGGSHVFIICILHARHRIHDSTFREMVNFAELNGNRHEIIRAKGFKLNASSISKRPSQIGHGRQSGIFRARKKLCNVRPTGANLSSQFSSGNFIIVHDSSKSVHSPNRKALTFMKSPAVIGHFLAGCPLLINAHPGLLNTWP
jgi:hypothetical protein